MPEVRPGFTLVEILARPVNPMDLLMIRGLYPLRPELPAIPGAEGVGRVIAVDPDESAPRGSRPHPGALVLLPIRHGSWCSHSLVPSSALLTLDPQLDPLQACMLRVNPTTAHLLLADSGLQEGEAFVHGPGSGSVGQLLTQIARRRGLTSIAVVRRPEAATALRRLGAHEVVVDGPDLAAELRRVSRRLGSPLRVAFDGVGGDFSRALSSALEPGGKIVCYGAMSRQGPGLQVSDCVFRNIRLEGFWLLDWRRRAGPHQEDAVVTELSRTGLTSQIADQFSLTNFAEALRLAESGAAAGRVILV